MSLTRQKLGLLALVALMALPGAGQTSTAPKTTGKVKTGVSRKKSAAKPKVVEPEPLAQQAPPPPPPPQRPFEMSPVPAQVTYEGGQLTITAPNSTLADILSQVRARTGTKVEFPANASQERVALQLGPGSPRAVLTQLLQGSPFDYILLGSEQDSNAVTQVMLMRREAGGTQTAATGNIPNRAPAQAEPSDEESENEPPPAPAPMAPRPTPGQMVPGQPANNAQSMGQPASVPEQNAAGAPQQPPAQAQPGQASPDNTPKTPEQLLQQLQQMQKQEQDRRQRPPR